MTTAPTTHPVPRPPHREQPPGCVMARHAPRRPRDGPDDEIDQWPDAGQPRPHRPSRSAPHAWATPRDPPRPHGRPLPRLRRAPRRPLHLDPRRHRRRPPTPRRPRASREGRQPVTRPRWCKCGHGCPAHIHNREGTDCGSAPTAPDSAAPGSPPSPAHPHPRTRQVTIHTKLTLAVAAAGLLAIATAALTWQLRGALRRLERPTSTWRTTSSATPTTAATAANSATSPTTSGNSATTPKPAAPASPPHPSSTSATGTPPQQLHCDLPDGHRGAHQADQGDGLPPPSGAARPSQPGRPRRRAAAARRRAAGHRPHARRRRPHPHHHRPGHRPRRHPPHRRPRRPPAAALGARLQPHRTPPPPTRSPPP
jgi:hypothetical protein